MLVPKKNRIAVYSYLFKEGVIVAPKDLTIDHKEIKVSNLQVVKLMISLKSRGYVKENFAWAHHYFYLTDEGIDYLRDYLHLPAEIIPATLKKATPAVRPPGARAFEDESAMKEGGGSGEFRPSFRRDGAPPQQRQEGYRREGGAPRSSAPRQ
jgi:small subunit ribosomal protein S10e